MVVGRGVVFETTVSQHAIANRSSTFSGHYLGRSSVNQPIGLKDEFVRSPGKLALLRYNLFSGTHRRFHPNVGGVGDEPGSEVLELLKRGTGRLISWLEVVKPLLSGRELGSLVGFNTATSSPSLNVTTATILLQTRNPVVHVQPTFSWIPVHIELSA